MMARNNLSNRIDGPDGAAPKSVRQALPDAWTFNTKIKIQYEDKNSNATLDTEFWRSTNYSNFWRADTIRTLAPVLSQKTPSGDFLFDIDLLSYSLAERAHGSGVS